MAFYEELSKYYDEVFPPDRVTVDFLKEFLDKDSSVLDLACGTGSYTIALAPYAGDVMGIDLDDEMVRIAEMKKSQYGVRNVTFRTGDMTDLGDIPEESVDLIYCIGNSLVHLKDREEVQSFVRNMMRRLKKEGTLILQTINFERIMDRNHTGLPTIETERVEFIRNYDYEKESGTYPERVQFHTYLRTEDGSVHENSVPLLTLRKDEIVSMIDDVIENGYRMETEVYGNFRKSPFITGESVPIVIRSTKK